MNTQHTPLRSPIDQTSVLLMESRGEILNFLVAQAMGLTPRVEKTTRLTLVPVGTKLEKRMGVNLGAAMRGKWVRFAPATDKAHALQLRRAQGITATRYQDDNYTCIRGLSRADIRQHDHVIDCPASGQILVFRPCSAVHHQWMAHRADRTLPASQLARNVYGSSRDEAVARGVVLRAYAEDGLKLKTPDIRISVDITALARLRHEL